MLLCDGGCARGYHLSCLNLTSVPEGETWLCPYCARQREKEKERVKEKEREREREKAKVKAAAEKKGDCLVRG